MVHESESIIGFYLFIFKNLSLYNHNVGDRGTEKRKEKEARRRGEETRRGEEKRRGDVALPQLPVTPKHFPHAEPLQLMLGSSHPPLPRNPRLYSLFCLH